MPAQKKLKHSHGTRFQSRILSSGSSSSVGTDTDSAETEAPRKKPISEDITSKIDYIRYFIDYIHRFNGNLIKAVMRQGEEISLQEDFIIQNLESIAATVGTADQPSSTVLQNKPDLTLDHEAASFDFNPDDIFSDIDFGVQESQDLSQLDLLNSPVPFESYRSEFATKMQRISNRAQQIEVTQPKVTAILHELSKTLLTTQNMTKKALQDERDYYKKEAFFHKMDSERQTKNFDELTAKYTAAEENLSKLQSKIQTNDQLIASLQKDVAIASEQRTKIQEGKKRLEKFMETREANLIKLRELVTSDTKTTPEQKTAALEAISVGLTKNQLELQVINQSTTISDLRKQLAAAKAQAGQPLLSAFRVVKQGSPNESAAAAAAPKNDDKEDQKPVESRVASPKMT